MTTTPTLSASRLEAGRLEAADGWAGSLGRPLAATLTFFFLATITTWPAVLLARPEVRQAFADFGVEVDAGWQAAATAREANAVVRDGIVHFDQALEKASHWPDGVIGGWQGFLWELGVGNEDVVLGRDGWLEYQPALKAVLGPPFLDEAVLRARRRPPTAKDPGYQPDPRPAIALFQRELAARGIALWMLPAPSKVSVHPEPFSPRWREVAAPLRNTSFPRFAADVAALGVTFVDPMPLILEVKAERGKAYLRNDSHWSPEVIDGVARQLAERLEAEVTLAARIQPAWRQWPRERDHPGDLLKILRLPMDWVPERTELKLLRRVGKERWQPTPTAEVLLIGDSFAKVFAHGAGLTEELTFHLGRPVDRIAYGGGGAAYGRIQLIEELRANPARLDGKKVVIWEFAERDLGSADWPILPLPAPTRN